MCSEVQAKPRLKISQIISQQNVQSSGVLLSHRRQVGGISVLSSFMPSCPSIFPCLARSHVFLQNPISGYCPQFEAERSPPFLYPLSLLYSSLQPFKNVSHCYIVLNSTPPPLLNRWPTLLPNPPPPTIIPSWKMSCLTGCPHPFCEKQDNIRSLNHDCKTSETVWGFC